MIATDIMLYEMYLTPLRAVRQSAFVLVKNSQHYNFYNLHDFVS